MSSKRAFPSVLLLALLGIYALYCVTQPFAPMPSSKADVLADDNLFRMERSIIWTPFQIVQFSKNNPDITTHPELVRRLNEAGLKDQWLAYSVDVYGGLGTPEATVLLLKLGQHEAKFSETIRVLADIAKNTTSTTSNSQKKPEIVVIPQEWLKDDPRSVVEALMEKYLHN